MSDVLKMGRALTADEQAQLQAQGCLADDWSNIRVAADFIPDFIIGVLFSGANYLGRFDQTFPSDGGAPKYAGIFHAQIHQCIIHNQVQIRNIGRVLANYEIGSGSRIEQVQALYCEGFSSFGNGCKVSVLDETGGKAVSMYEGLSSHTAYLAAVFSHRKLLVQKISELADAYAESVRSERGRIGAGCVIRDAGVIRNVRLGDGCVIEGALRLEEGSLCSSPAADGLAFSKIGAGVIARHFILAAGAEVTDASQIEHTFVGESVLLSKGFSAHDSLFFANSQMENGEACASFAGPYSVSMHKSTLMVGGLFSFCNFGSGTNQSNHFYKLGPMHSGILERGCKTGSDAYLLWPGRVGAFTFIKGRFLSNPVTTDFPFSYLLEEDGVGYLSPGAALRSVGTLRDALKWPARDRRAASDPADKICFEVLNPFTISALRKGLAQMDEWISQPDQVEFLLSGAVVRKSAVVKGRKLYQAALDCFRGSVLMEQLEHRERKAAELLQNVRAVDSADWADISGLLMPESELQACLATVETGQLADTKELERLWSDQFRHYADACWAFVLADLSAELNKATDELQLSDLMQLVDRWEVAQSGLYKQMNSDADLELSMMHRFQGGEKPTHSFVGVLQGLLEEVPAKAAQVRAILNA